jgi:hypothetical protein
MEDKEQIKTIIQQYADKSIKNFNEFSVKEDKEVGDGAYNAIGYGKY